MPMAAKKVSREIPLMEITLRRYEKPSNLDDRELVRKLCLSFGLLQPGDSRDVIVDIFYTLLDAKKRKSNLTAGEIEKIVIEERKKRKLPMVGIASSNIMRQLRRLREAMLAEKHLSTYRISENMKIEEIFQEKVEKYMLSSVVERLKEYCRKVDERF